MGESGMLGYLIYMAERLIEMERLLKSTGAIYLHCDPTASHYLKMIMDNIFGAKNFRNEIIWHYHMGSSGKKHFRRKHDVILFFCKSKKSLDLQVSVPRRMEGRYNHIDEDGRKYHINGAGKIFYEDEEIIPDDVWTYIADPKFTQINSNAKERLGYPTQKPLYLLNRIVEASCPPNGIVMDPFCGCGTTIESAIKLDRNFVGIDISAFAIDLIKTERLNDPKIQTMGIPYDMYSARKLAKENPFNFESWAVTRLPGFAPNTKQVADGGVDGRGKLKDKPKNIDSKLALAQVKGGKFNLSNLRDFIHVNDRDKSALGVYITLENSYTSNARSEVAKLGEIHFDHMNYDRLNLWSIEDYFDKRMISLPQMMNPYNGKPLVKSLF